MSHSSVASLAALALVASCASSEKKADAPAPAPAASKPAGPQLQPPGVQPPMPGEEILDAQPSLAPLADFQAPVPVVSTLPNGLRVYVVHKPGAALETIALVVKKGATSDPADRPGLASLAAAAMEAGAGGKSQAEMAAAADALGASLHAAAATDATLFSVSGMPAHLDAMVPLLADLALRPNLLAAEFEKVKAERVAQLQAELAEPRVAAGRAFAAALYGDSPLGRAALGTPASVQATTLDEVKRFIGSYSPAESAVIIVGGADPQATVALVTQELGKWGPAVVKPEGKSARAEKSKKGKSAPELKHDAVTPQAAVAPMPAIALAALPAEERPRFVFVDFKGRPQTVLRVGLPGVPRSSPDVLALRLMNSILGGSFTSRLNQNLREQHGYTYGAGSNFAFGVGPGPFAVSTSVKTNVTAASLAEILKELARAVGEPLSDEEVAKGKALLAYQLVETLQHTEGTAAAIAEMFIDGLPNDELATFVPRLRALTAAEVQAAAKRAVSPEQLTIVMAGDETAVLPQLEAAGLKLPPPEPRDALGAKLAK